MNRIAAIASLLFLSITSLLYGQQVFPDPFQPVCATDEWHAAMAAEDPQFAKEIAHYVNEAVPLLAAGKGRSTEPLLTITVVVHVIHNGEPIGQGQNISDEQIEAQIAILNEDFTALNPQFYQTPSKWAGAAGVPNIQFCLASKDPAGNPTNGITRHQMQVTGSSWNNNNINSEIKPATNWDPHRYMNVYVLPIPGTTAAGGVVGFANYPTPSLIGAPTDGIVIDYRWFGAPGFPASGYRPLTHEVGHYLGVLHPFHGNSCSSDDGIDDTPNIDKATREYVMLDCDSIYPPGPVSCGNEHMYVNYMDYVNENCYTSFTQGQINLMRAVLQGTSQGFGYGSRKALLDNAPNQCNLVANDAGIIRQLDPPTVSCTTDSLSPRITLRNFGTDDLDSVLIITRIDNQTPDTFLYTLSMFPGENRDVVLPAIFPPNGPYQLTIYTALPNGAADERPDNDTLRVQLFTYVAIPPPLFESFENDTTLPTASGIFSFNLNADDFTWQLTDLASAWGEGSRSVMFDNFAGTPTNNPFGTVDALITRHYDLRNQSGSLLRFDVAYAPFSSQLTDTLLVMVATNCTQLFNQLLFKKGGVQLSTAPPTTGPFVPAPTQWRKEAIDLSAFDGMSDVTLAFINISGWGNRLYIDNIQLGQSCNTLQTNLNTTPSICSACTGTAEVLTTGGNPPFSYEWSNGLGNGPTIENLCSGPLSVTITDSFGCSNTASATIGTADGPSATVSATHETAWQAHDGTASVNVAGGSPPYTYSWSNGASGSSVAGLAPGTYGVTVTDANGCTTSASVIIEAYQCGSIDVTVTAQDVSCHGGQDGSLSASASGGVPPFSWSWSNGANTPTVSGLPAGNYSVTLTGADNCQTSATASINQPDPLTPNLSVTHETAAGAADGSATVNPQGGVPPYAYVWSNGANTASITNLPPGTYSVTVTDSKGCTATAQAMVQPFSCSGFGANVSSQDVSCFGLSNGTASASATGGNAPITFQWSTGATTSTISGLAPGTYWVTVSDASQCSEVLSVTIGQPPQLLPNASASNESTAGAADGTASANPSGGTPPFTFAWNTGATSASIEGLAPGTYTVTVTDSKGCTASQSVQVQAGPGCNLAIETFTMPASCPDVADGYAEISSVSGAAGPFTYQWSNGGTNFFISNIPAGEYTVTVSSSSGCSKSFSVTVGSSDVQNPTLVTHDVVAALDANGVAIPDPAALTEGSSDNCSMFDVEVNPPSFSCAEIGNYVVTVKITDSSGNSTTGSATVTVVDGLPPGLDCPADVVVDHCSQVTYPPVMAIDNCGTALVELLEGLPSGSDFPIGQTTVRWKATDAVGNEAECVFIVDVLSDLAILIDTVMPSTGAMDGAIQFGVQGGKPPYEVSVYQDGVPRPDLSPAALPPGMYQLHVADAAGCAILSAVVEVPLGNATLDQRDEAGPIAFPNPTTGRLHIGWDAYRLHSGSAHIFGATGKLVGKAGIPAGAGQVRLDLGSLPAGVYLLRVTAGSKVAWLKVIRQ